MSWILLVEGLHLSNTIADSHPYSDADTNNAVRHAIADADADTNTNANSDANANADSDANANADVNFNTHANSNLGAVLPSTSHCRAG